MTREEAIIIIREHVVNENIVKHMLATEAVMGGLTKRLNGNEEEWKLAGLLHDGDYRDDVPVEKQGIQIGQWVEEKEYTLSEEIKHAMAAHNWNNTGIAPQSNMDWALFCADSLTGLIVATALVYPDKKLANITVDSVLKKFKSPGFAKGTRREDIAMCEEKLGIPLNEFIGIALQSMQKISHEIGL